VEHPTLARCCASESRLDSYRHCAAAGRGIRGRARQATPADSGIPDHVVDRAPSPGEEPLHKRRTLRVLIALLCMRAEPRQPWARRRRRRCCGWRASSSAALSWLLSFAWLPAPSCRQTTVAESAQWQLTLPLPPRQLLYRSLPIRAPSTTAVVSWRPFQMTARHKLEGCGAE
jgi:hypothetical protein